MMLRGTSFPEIIKAMVPMNVTTNSAAATRGVGIFIPFPFLEAPHRVEKQDHYEDDYQQR